MGINTWNRVNKHARVSAVRRILEKWCIRVHVGSVDGLLFFIPVDLLYIFLLSNSFHCPVWRAFDPYPSQIASSILVSPTFMLISRELGERRPRSTRASTSLFADCWAIRHRNEHESSETVLCVLGPWRW